MTNSTPVSTITERYEAAPEPLRRHIDRLLDQSRDDHAWTRQLGPVYRQTDVAALLGKSKQAVSTDRGLLRLEMRSGAIGYPVFQFEGDRVLPGLRQVILELGPVVASSWTIASWLTSPQADLGGTPPLTWLRRGDLSPVIASARRFAAAAAR